MLNLGVIIFREFLEISLLISMVLVSFKNYNRKGLAVLIGFFTGITCSVFLGFIITEISNLFEGNGQEVFDILILSFSLFLIFITVNINYKKPEFKLTKLNKLFDHNQLLIISSITFLVVLREGIEIFLLVYSAFISYHISITQLIFTLVCVILIILPFHLFIYFGSIKIPYKKLFNVSSWFLSFLAGGMAVKLANLLVSVDLINYSSNYLWDSSFIISNHSTIGKILNSLFGYNPKPNIIEIIFFLLGISLTHIKKIYNFIKKSCFSSINDIS